MLRSEVGAETTKPADHFISNQQNVVLVQNRLDFIPVTFRRGNDTTRAKHRLSDESTDGLRTFSLNHGFEKSRSDMPGAASQ